MQGFRFLVVGSDGVPTNHGIILEAITPERYLCQFARNPPYSRIMRLEVVEGWFLFPTDETMNAYISSLHKPADPKEPAAPKKPAKKATRKKTNVKK